MRKLWFYFAALLISLPWSGGLPLAQSSPETAVAQYTPPTKPPLPGFKLRPPEAVTRLPVPLSTPADAVLFARDDAIRLGKDAYYVRYIWEQAGDTENIAIGSLAANLVSFEATFGQLVDVGKGYVYRIDLRYLTSHTNPADFKRFKKVWEELRFDPNFQLLVTKDTVKLLQKFYGGEAKVKVLRLGKVVEVDVAKLLEGEVARLPAPQIPKQAFLDLRNLTDSEAPVVSLPYFLVRSMSAIKDQGGSATVFGGLYYELLGTEEKPAKGTAEDTLFKRVGVGDGVNAVKFFERLPAERRLAMWESLITGKPRRVDLLPAQTRTTGAWLSVTHDPDDGNEDSFANAMKSLIKIKDKARETIYVLPNGLHGFALFNGEGALQREAPLNVVGAEPAYHARSGAVKPHSMRLQPGVSCINCHWAKDDKSLGFRTLHNDVLTLKKRRGFIPIDDVNLQDKKQEDVVAQLEALYQGDPTDILVDRARDDLSAAVLQAVHPWPLRGGKGDLTDVVQLAGSRLWKLYAEYLYEPVDARQALRELGIKPPDKLEDAVMLFNLRVPPVKLNEDVTVGSLHGGLAVSRFSWSISYSYVAGRLLPDPQRGKPWFMPEPKPWYLPSKN